MDGTPARPGQRPFRARSDRDLAIAFESALAAGEGAAGAHCIHECWMHGRFAARIESALAGALADAGISRRRRALSYCRVAAIA
jgi:hypothetical protein